MLSLAKYLEDMRESELQKTRSFSWILAEAEYFEAMVL
jgi:hypothetical protein